MGVGMGCKEQLNMPSHRRPRSLKKLPASLVLGLTALSVGSPVAALLVFPEKAQGESIVGAMLLSPSPSPDTPEPISTAVRSTTTVLAKAKEKVLPTSKRPQITTHTTHTTTSVPVSKPDSAVTTKPKPTVAQRQIQSATRSTTKPKQVAPSTTKATPQPPPPPPTVRRTTKAEPPPPPPPKPTIKKTTPTTTTTKKEEPPPPPKVPSPPSHQSLVQLAQKYVGREIPYQMGGNSLSGGMDCSHFIWMVLKEAGYSVPYRDSAGLASWTVRTSTPQPGDLVLYRGHASIYAGDGMMIDQGKPGGAHLQKVYTQNFIGYGRIPI